MHFLYVVPVGGAAGSVVMGWMWLIHLHVICLNAWQSGILGCQPFGLPHRESEVDRWQAVLSACFLPDILPPSLERAAGMLLWQSQVLDVFVGGDGDDCLDHLIQDPFLHMLLYLTVKEQTRSCHKWWRWMEQPLCCCRACACWVFWRLWQRDLYLSPSWRNQTCVWMNHAQKVSSSWRGSAGVAPEPELWHQTFPLPQPL